VSAITIYGIKVLRLLCLTLVLPEDNRSGKRLELYGFV
jgi:hypothetical protein